ncbi:MAG: Xaa-Pro peptidase family protein [Candidatus Poribacteria bacterium]|nr:Xaa-Pro peptidase family protein [Candidatus Poribacteria bacterium]
MDARTAILLVEASENSANMYYATQFFAPDAFIYLETADERVVVIGNLEFERARATAKVDRVLPLVQYWKMAQEKYSKMPGTEEVVDILLREFGIDKVIVPPDFNIKFADGIRGYDYQVEVKLEPFFERRQTKNEDEIGKIVDTVKHTELAIETGIDMVRSAKIIADGTLELDGKPLTSEMIRRTMHGILAEADCFATHTVVSSGGQTALPHEEGTGVLHENQPIIIDCSPRSRKNGYYADITRTVLRGTAPISLRRQYEAVLAAQQHGIEMLKPGVNGKDIHAAVAQFLSDKGFKTHVVEGKPQGFFHATGHSIGVEAHERPRLALRDEFIEIGNVVTIEPGLYYMGVGGIRIEDDIHVTDDGPVSLSTIDKTLEL